MITESCWACTDRIMADFEQREYDTRQHFPEQKRTDESIYPFTGLLDFSGRWMRPQTDRMADSKFQGTRKEPQKHE